jgi:hypothetical protein
LAKFERSLAIVREPPGGLIQDRDYRESLGQQPESLQPLSSRQRVKRADEVLH